MYRRTLEEGAGAAEEHCHDAHGSSGGSLVRWVTSPDSRAAEKVSKRAYRCLGGAEGHAREDNASSCGRLHIGESDGGQASCRRCSRQGGRRRQAGKVDGEPPHPPPSHRAASLALSQVALFKCCLVHGSWRASRRWQTASARSGRARTREKSASLHDILPQRDSRRGASQ